MPKIWLDCSVSICGPSARCWLVPRPAALHEPDAALCSALQVLCIQGFLACRKHADRIILLVEMMQGSGCPCFKAGPRAVTALRKRFHLTLPESQVPFMASHSIMPCVPQRRLQCCSQSGASPATLAVLSHSPPYRLCQQTTGGWNAAG